MPTWDKIGHEIQEHAEDPGRCDIVRRRYLTRLAEHTGRDVILYAAKCTQWGPNLTSDAVSVSHEDMQGIMTVVHGLRGPRLDLIIHSTGGSLEAAECMVTYLRSRFRHIRVVVPHIAMSAAAAMALGGDVLLLGKHSFLGPIDPQIRIPTPLGTRWVPAQAILAQFEQAEQDCTEDPKKLPVWVPMLAQYGPDLLQVCKNVSEMARTLAARWLRSYMFRRVSEPARTERAVAIASWLGDHQQFKSHGRCLEREELASHGVRIEKLEKDDDLQDLVLSVFHATTHTFQQTPAVKVIENQNERAFIQQVQVVQVQRPVQPAAGT